MGSKISPERMERILDELLFWAQEVINDEDEFKYTAEHSWGLTEDEMKKLNIE